MLILLIPRSRGCATETGLVVFVRNNPWIAHHDLWCHHEGHQAPSYSRSPAAAQILHTQREHQCYLQCPPIWNEAEFCKVESPQKHSHDCCCEQWCWSQWCDTRRYWLISMQWRDLWSPKEWHAPPCASCTTSEPTLMENRAITYSTLCAVHNRVCSFPSKCKRGNAAWEWLLSAEGKYIKHG